jgi:hypothetical protein
MLMFCATAEGQKEWDATPEAAREANYAKIGQYFGQNADKLVMTHELQGPRTAKTVRFDAGRASVTDGPFIEAKEVIGGYAVFDVDDEAAALELAKAWPGSGIVEVRPVIER